MRHFLYYRGVSCMTATAHHHRPALKQINKRFKSSSSAKINASGKTAKADRVKKGSHPRSNAALSKAARSNRNKLIARYKQQQLDESRSMFDKCPRVVAVFDLSAAEPLASPTNFQCLDNLPGFKFIDCFSASQQELLPMIAAIQAADYILFLAKRDTDYENIQKSLWQQLKCIRSIGVPRIEIAIVDEAAEMQMDVESGVQQRSGFSQTQKAAEASRKKAMQFVSFNFAAESSRPFYLPREVELMKRKMATAKLKAVHWRDVRPYLVVDKQQLILDESSKVKQGVVHGWNRGRPFRLENLLFFGGVYGQISRIERNGNNVQFGRNDEFMETECPPECLGDTLGDTPMDTPMDTHLDSHSDYSQSDHEMQLSLDSSKELRQMKKVPRGTSSYQAAWYPDEDDTAVCFDEFDEIPLETDQDSGDFDLDAYKKFCEANQIDSCYSDTSRNKDEIYLDPGMSAKKRLYKYRGLKQFRSSKWNLDESLPAEYSLIHKFADWQRSKKEALNANFSNEILVGDYISIHFTLAEAANLDLVQNMPCIFGLLPNEDKETVLNFTVQFDAQATDHLNEKFDMKIEEKPNLAVKSKDELVALIGFRAVKVRPIYSDNIPGNVHKYERFLHEDEVDASRMSQVLVGTCYAPVSYPPTSILLFRSRSDKSSISASDYVGFGSVLDCNPNRLAIKRLTLTGNPYKIHRKSVVVRFMFFNKEDVQYFKPIQLVTRKGIKGHIRDSLGTKGYMKCVFEKSIGQQDLVQMHLYKRQFPPKLDSGSLFEFLGQK